MFLTKKTYVTAHRALYEANRLDGSASVVDRMCPTAVVRRIGA